MSRAADPSLTARLMGMRAWRRTLRAAAERALFSSAFYRFSLLGATPANLVERAPQRAGDARRGRAILEHDWSVAGAKLGVPDPFAPEPPMIEAPPESLPILHGFGWLADLRAEGSAEASARARELITAWIARFGEWTPIPWRADVLGRRLVSWLGEFLFFEVGAEPAFHARFLKSLGRQARHLERLAKKGGAWLGPPGYGRLLTLAALMQTSACLPGGKERTARALALLLRECERQVLPDGGHYQRSPAVQLELFETLIGVRRTLVARKLAIPTALQATLDRMAPMLRFFRHGDGGLALFNHTSEGDAGAIDAALAAGGADGKPPLGAPHAGFQRLSAGQSLVIVDTGQPPAPETDGLAHAGTLSFELSLGAERVVVNCGARPRAAGAWLVAQRATAAHSTLVLNDANSSEILPDGRLGRRPRHVLCRREDADGATLVDASHDGYAAPFGALHRRRLYLSPDGADLRGEDRLSRIRPGEVMPVAVRFHLHPGVQTSLLHDGTAALLRLPSGAGLRLDAAGGTLALEESVYFGADAPRRSEQIVIATTLAGDETVVKWSLKRVSA
ncbi:MAG TPA: heparinase II/III family protein [Alphaproteobacteria bacterium]|nr:heparinase II/III family protein [Alphaproteobacteria bacterium]